MQYQVENLRDVFPELDLIFQQHWEEIALHRDKVPLDIDRVKYLEHADNGSLHVVTVRDNGLLIGYHISIIAPHLHYKSTLHGLTDVYYIKPEYRKGFVGIKMFKFVEQDLKKRGVKKLYTGTKKHLDMGKIFHHLGYSETETLFTKYIGD